MCQAAIVHGDSAAVEALLENTVRAFRPLFSCGWPFTFSVPLMCLLRSVFVVALIVLF
jgi:hypothetical protein